VSLRFRRIEIVDWYPPITAENDGDINVGATGIGVTTTMSEEEVDGI
jgi:hypothetical protein